MSIQILIIPWYSFLVTKKKSAELFWRVIIFAVSLLHKIDVMKEGEKYIIVAEGRQGYEKEI